MLHQTLFTYKQDIRTVYLSLLQKQTMQRERGWACLLCNNEEFAVSKTNKANTKMTWCLCCALYGCNNERRPEISHEALNNEAKIGENRSIHFSSPHCFSFCHNYEGINNLKHVHLHLPLLNHAKLSKKDKGSFQDHSKILVRPHPTLLDAIRWFIGSFWTLLIDVVSELNEFKLIKSHQYHSILLDLPMLDDIGCVQRDSSVWKDGGYDSMNIYTHLLFIHGRVLWSWFNVNLEFKHI